MNGATTTLAPELAAAGRALLRLVPTSGPLETECWRWPGSKTHDGYARISAGGKAARPRVQYVHVLLYRVLVGPIPEGLQLDHLCKIRDCANPAHLEAVTHAENLRRGDGFAGQKARQTHCIHGHEYTKANTRISADGTRDCRACIRDRDRARWPKRREQQKRYRRAKREAQKRA